MLFGMRKLLFHCFRECAQVLDRCMRREEGGGAGRESERVRCLGTTTGGGLCFSFVSPGVRKRGGAYAEENGYVW